MSGLSWPECPVCRCVYREPRILTCGHTVCLSCLAKLQLVNDYSEGHELVCPVCRSITMLDGDVSTLRRNFALEELIDARKRDVERGFIFGGCSRHQLAEGQFFCTNCDQIACMECVVSYHCGHHLAAIEVGRARLTATCESKLKPLCESISQLKHVTDQQDNAIRLRLQQARETDKAADVKLIENLITELTKLLEVKLDSLRDTGVYIDEASNVLANRNLISSAESFVLATRELSSNGILSQVAERSSEVDLECARLRKQANWNTNLASHVDLRGQIASLTETVRKVNSPKALLCVGGYDGSSETAVAEVCDVQESSGWRRVLDANNRSWAAAATLNGVVYITGGSDSYTSTTRYDAAANSWIKCAETVGYRCEHALVALKDTLYAIGGSSANTIERYDVSADKWSQVAELRHDRRGVAAVALGTRRLLIIGGMSGDYFGTVDARAGCLADCEMYEPDDEDGRSSAVAPMQQPRVWAAAAVCDVHVYVFGGLNEQCRYMDTMEQFSVLSNCWSQLSTRLLLGRRGCGAATLDGRIYIAGGNTPSEETNTVECFQPTTQSIVRLDATLSVARRGVALAVLEKWCC